MLASTQPAYSVSDLTHYVKHLLEHDDRLRGVRVAGEVSNLTYHNSGHVYFSLKDAGAQLSCVMFRSYAQSAPRMQAGDQVVLTGNMSVYAPRGNYQLLVVKVEKQGLGDLYQQFLALKARLQSEGLFDPALKRPIPAFPEHIAVITSPTGAAVKDIIRTLQRRYDRAKVSLVPAVVQGEQGVASIVRALALAQQSEAEVILLARGGGSLEDLWNFNEEAVARAIRASQIPVITGIGHETDVTIADFVADLRAATPTAAAERAVPEKAAILYTLEEYERQLRFQLQHFVDFKRQVLDDFEHRLQQAIREYIRQKQHSLALLETQLKGLDIRDRLKQGYILALKNGKVQTSAEVFVPGDALEAIFADGRVSTEVTEVKPPPDSPK